MARHPEQTRLHPQTSRHRVKDARAFKRPCGRSPVPDPRPLPVGAIERAVWAGVYAANVHGLCFLACELVCLARHSKHAEYLISAHWRMICNNKNDGERANRTAWTRRARQIMQLKTKIAAAVMAVALTLPLVGCTSDTSCCWRQTLGSVE